MTICKDRPEPGAGMMSRAGVIPGGDLMPRSDVMSRADLVPGSEAMSGHHVLGDDGSPTPPPVPTGAVTDEAGSLVTEYGLLAVVAATVCGVVIQWASGGAIVRLFNALLNAARDLVGA